MEGIRSMRKKRPQRPQKRPEDVSSSDQPAKEEDEDEDPTWFSSFTSLGKSIGHVLNEGHKNSQLPAPLEGLPNFKPIAP